MEVIALLGLFYAVGVTVGWIAQKAGDKDVDIGDTGCAFALIGPVVAVVALFLYYVFAAP